MRIRIVSGAMTGTITEVPDLPDPATQSLLDTGYAERLPDAAVTSEPPPARSPAKPVKPAKPRK